MITNTKTTNRHEREKLLKLWDGYLETGKFALAPPSSLHPEASTLAKFQWEGMLSIDFNSASYVLDNAQSEARRDKFVVSYMNALGHLWNLRDRDLYWIAATEYGEGGDGHCHIIFSFDHLRKKEQTQRIPNLASFGDESYDSLLFVCKELQLHPLSVDLHWLPAEDFGPLLANYICKREYGHEDYKHFVWSDKLRKEAKK